MRRRDRIGWRLLLSHLAIVVVGSVALLGGLAIVAQQSFESAMGHTMAQMGEMGARMEPVLRRAFADAIDNALIFATVVAAVSAVTAGGLLARWISRPLERLAAASRRIAAGRYAERVPVGSSGEIGELARSFNVMAASLEAEEDRRRRLVDDVAHELRTPLATLDGYLEGLEDGIVPPDDHTWAILRGESSKLTRLVEDLQELWRAEAGQVRLEAGPLLLSKTATDLIARFTRRAADHRVAVESRIDDPDVVVTADERRLSQVLDNLMSNALRYSDEGTSVLVTVGRSQGLGVISVRDHGQGLGAEDRSRIFERFYRVDPARSRALGGSGLGLAISKALVEHMGGAISVESEGRGHGSTFSVQLPLARG